MKKDKFEELIDEGIKINFEEIEVPNLTSSWEVIEKELRNNNNKKNNQFNKKIACIIAIIALFSYLSMGINNEGEANFRQILNLIINEDKDSINMSLDYKNSDDIMKESKENNGIVRELISLEELKMLNFPYKMPTYVPKGYTFKGCLLKKIDSLIVHITLIYESTDDKIEINQRPIRGESSEAIKLNSKYAKVYQFSENGFNYQVIQIGDNDFEIIWDMFGIKYHATSKNGELLKNVVKSIK